MVEGRFGELPGYRAWRNLIERIVNPEAGDRERFNAFDDFLDAIDIVDPNLVKNCELGRAKARKIFSSQAAGWFDPPKILPPGCPEYVHLAHQTFSHQDVENWLMKRGRYA